MANLPDKELQKLPFPEIIDKNPTVPLCLELTKEKRKSELILIHHLNETGFQFIKALSNAYKIRKIIGIPYSSVPEIVEKLENDFDVTVAEMKDIPRLAKEAVQSSNKPVIIEEIGGYTTEIAEFLDKTPHVLGIVEVTMQGYWRWQKLQLTRLPVLSIAASKLKATENSITGKKIINGVTYFLSSNGFGQLKDKKVLLIGYGNIGREVARHLKPLCKKLTVHDRNNIKIITASNDYDVSKDWTDIDLVVGVTGSINHSINSEDAKKLKSGVILVSGSSRDVEFDLKDFLENASRVNEQEEYTEYYFGDKKIIIANKGQPIDFRYVSTPSGPIEAPFAGTITCLNRIDSGYKEPGLHDITEKEQQELAQKYIEIYSKFKQ